MTPAISINATDNSQLEKKINTIAKLESELEDLTADNKVTDVERNYLKENLDSKVAQEYLALHDEEIKDVVNNSEGELLKSSYDEKSNKYINNYEFKVNDVISVEASFEDEPDTNYSLAKSTITNGGGPKDLGDRKSTGKYKETILGLSIVELHLTLGYTVKKSSITTRYSSTSGSTSYGSLSSSSYITDSVAAKKGHDMNCIGDYSIDLLGYTSTTVSLELKVKWYDSYSDGSKYILYTLSKL